MRGRAFTTNRQLLLYLNVCQRKQQEQQNQQLEENNDQTKPIRKPFYWNEKPGTTFFNELNNAYDKIVY